jgi:hypothetical protein
MTVTPVEGVFESNCTIPLPSKSYVAVRLTAIT